VGSSDGLGAKKFLILAAQVRSAFSGSRKLSPKMPIFSILYPVGSKNLIGLGQKNGRVSLLFTASQKYALFR